MKTSLGLRTRGKSGTLSFLALAVLVAATTGATGVMGAANGHVSSGASRTFLVPVASDPADCSTDSSLCLQQGRFLISATWKKPDGSSGPAHALRLTPDSGYFWFFEPGNVELVVKALDGCSINSRYWFFSGGLTNLDVTISVADTVSGKTTTYSNPQGTAFRPIVDMDSLSSCPAVGTALSARSPEEPGETDLTALPVAPQAATGSALTLGCAESDSVLCIAGRFQVEATWQSAAGKTGTAHAVSLTSEAGYFWFFEPGNVELVVKTVDACGIGHGQWFFAAGMTTVGVRLKVTDTFTSEVKTYSNTLGTAFLPIQDTAAFSFCPTARFHVVMLGCDKTRSCHAVLRNCDFSLPEIHVRIGDTVKWEWGSGIHSVTSGTCSIFRPCDPDGIWDSGVQAGPSSFTHTFAEAGTFSYFCSAGHTEWVRLSASISYCGLATRHEAAIVVVDP